MKTSIIKTNPHMYTNENPELWPDFGSIRVLIVQPNDQLIIFVDTQSCRPISGSIDNLRYSKCTHPIQMKDTLKQISIWEIN